MRHFPFVCRALRAAAYLLSCIALCVIFPKVASGQNCSFSLADGSQNYLVSGSDTTTYWHVQSSPAGCKWSVTSKDTWITSVTPSSGAGGSATTVVAIWQANGSPSQRVGNIELTSGTNTFVLTITQNTTLCNWTAPSSVSFPSQGGGVPISISFTPATARCAYFIVYDQAPWTKGNTALIESTPYSGSLTADANTAAQPRSGTVSLYNSPARIAVSQAAAGASTPTLSRVSCVSPSVASGQNVNCSVTLSGSAPSGGAVVTLASSSTAALTVPASVTVSAGATTGSFVATGRTVSASTSVTITASYGGANQTATVQVRPPLPTVSNLTCAASSLLGRQSTTCTVTLTSAAPTGGALVNLSSTSPLLFVPSAVTVAAGSTTATFGADALNVTSPATATITAAYNSSSLNTAIQLVPPPPTLSNLTCPQTLNSGASGTCTVTLSSAAPSGGAAVSLADNGALLTTPSSVTVSASATTATFTVTAGTITAATNVTVTAGYNEVSRTATIQLRPAETAALSNLTCSPTTVPARQNTQCTVTLTSGAPTGGASVTLASNSTLLPVPPNVAVAAGATSATFPATAGAVTAPVTATITATYSGVSKTASIQLTSPIQLSVQSLACGAASLFTGQSATCTVTLSSAASDAGTTVTLTSSSKLLSVPASVNVASGSATATFTATADTITAGAVATVTAALNGASKTASFSLVVLPSLTDLSCSTLSLGPGESTRCTVVLSAAAPTGGAAVTIASNNSSLTAPATINIAAGQTSGTFNATAASTLSAAGSAVLTARYNGGAQTELISWVPAASLARVSCTPSNLTSSQTFSCTVSLSSAAAAGGLAVTISSDNAAVPVPATVTVAANAASASFNGTAGSVTDAGTATITANARGIQQSTKITLTPPATLSRVTCSAKILNSGGSASCTAALSAAAPSGGATITLASSSPALTLSAASVTVEAGSSTASFKVNAGAVSSVASATITASYNGSSKTAAISLTAPITVSSLACAPSSVGAGQSTSCTVSLSSAAAVGGASVALTSTSSALPVPSSASVLAASTTASFSATAGTIAVAGTATITATYNSSSKTAAVSLTPPPPTLKVTPNTLTFSYQPGGTVPVQTIAVSGMPPGLAYTVSSDRAKCAWLKTDLTAGTAGAGSNVTVSVDRAGLSPGTYNCAVTIQGGSASQSVVVSFTVGAASLVLDQESVRLDYQIDGPAPDAQIKLSSSAAAATLSFMAAESCSWLDLSPKSGSTPAVIDLVLVNAGLSPNSSYSCVVNINAPDAQKPSLTVPVTLNTQAPPTVTPGSLNFMARQGNATPMVQTLDLSGPRTPVAFTASASTDSDGNWLSVSPTSGRTAATLSVVANPIGLSLPRYTGKITVAFAGAPEPFTVPVTLMLSPVTVSVVPNRLSFRYEQGTTPPAQFISVVASDASAPNFIVTPSASLSATRAGSNVIVSPTPGLAAGTTSGTITFGLTGAMPPSQTVPVSIMVDPRAVTNPALRLTPSAGLTFSLVQGANPKSEVLSIANQGGGSLNFTALASTRTGGLWLDVTCPQNRTTGAAPVPCSVTADPSKVVPNAAGGVAGTYAGEITVQGDEKARIPVTMTLTARPDILLSYSGLSFTVVRDGNSPPEESIQIVNGGGGSLQWTARVNTIGGGDWLKVDTLSGTATSSGAGSLDVTIDPKAFPPGTSSGPRYGSIVVNATDASGAPAANSPRTIGVVVNVLDATAHVSPLVRPSALIFTADAGDNDVDSQFVTISNLSGSAVGYMAVMITNDGVDWCSATPAKGSVAKTSTVGVDVDFTKLKPGQYSCQLRLIFEDGTAQNIVIAARAANSGVGAVSARAASSSRGLTPRAANPNCNPSGQPWTVLLSKPSPSNTFYVGQAVSLEVLVQDYCGNYVDNQAVSVGFSNNLDKGQALLSVGGGAFQGTWTPAYLSSTAAQSVVSLQAIASPSFATKLRGRAVAARSSRSPLVSPRRLPPWFRELAIPGAIRRRGRSRRVLGFRLSARI